jgi:galactose mutarotase-like enzyme
MERHTIAGNGLRATILAHGAELCSLQDEAGHELMWQAGPAWPRHAPVLFPIVGSLKGDSYKHGGQDYRLTQHGFARDMRFEWVHWDETSCRLELRDDDATRALYPFAFQLILSFSITDGVLTVGYCAMNTGNETLPVSMGAHPAFSWPLVPGIAKTDHLLTFEADEPAPMPRVVDGLLTPAIYPSVIHDRTLPLDEQLFADNALILPAPASHWVRYTAPAAPGLEMRWNGFPSFGIWMRPVPGADFLCLEPWHGMASPEDWDGTLASKPGMALLEPGAQLDAEYSLQILAPAP